jgi:DNA polymerase-3 subunit delta'
MSPRKTDTPQPDSTHPDSVRVIADAAALPWLAQHVATLRQWRDDGRLPHALLVHGPAGWGKQRLVRGWVAELLGVPTGSDDEPPAHPDLRWVTTDATTESRQIKIDQVRELNDYVASTSVRGRKVAVLIDAERMNTNAANALLKTLEEPPGSAHIVLVSERPWALLPTIRSRCSALVVRPDAAAADAWRARLPAATRPSDDVWWLAGGAPLTALSLQVSGEGEAQLAALAAIHALPAAPSRLASVVQQATACALPLLFDGWLRVLHTRQLAAHGVDRALPDWATAGNARSSAPGSALDALVDEIRWSKRAVLGTGNPNATLLLESLLLRWCAAAAG